MAVDLDHVEAFAATIVSTVALRDEAGESHGISRDELLELVEEARAARAFREQVDEMLPEIRLHQAVYEELGEYIEQAGEDVDPVLVSVYTQVAEDPEGDYPEELLDVVTGALQLLGVANPMPQQAAGLLDMINAWNVRQGGRHAEPEPLRPQVLVQPPHGPRGAPGPPQGRTTGRSRLVPVSTARVAEMLPPGGIPVPATPNPFREVTGEELFGLRRGPNGKYDAGDISGG